MPILDVTVIGALDASVREGAAQRVADAGGEALGAPLGETWARVRELDPDAYAESGGAASGARPVFVSVTRYELPPMRERAERGAALAKAVASAIARPSENVHVIFEPAAAGRIAFGGELEAGPPRHRVASAAKWEAIVGYARAVRVGDLVWVTGTTAFGEQGEPVGVGDAYAQARRCLENVRVALEALGASFEDVVRTRMFVTNIERDWEPIGRAHAEVFGRIRPATTMVEVRKLIADWMLVEIEVDAHLGG